MINYVQLTDGVASSYGPRTVSKVDSYGRFVDKVSTLHCQNNGYERETMRDAGES